ncbi:hypothetical protein M9H77_23870 [Catharanthus roseus]|uniref:Uncharacterized protein n=1 Tax=Catharanthus roseus TaxID=4058 RepID=A0ACC0AX14_CATRO|nr:hypothetical protein M9H77_23870 [Catharanthus roseus]
MAKYGRKSILPPTVALPLPSPVGFCRGIDQIFNEGRSSIKGGDLGKDLNPILQSKEDLHQSVGELSSFSVRVLRHLCQHGRCVPSYATNATSLERTRTTIFMPSKGCQGLKMRKEPNYEKSSRRDFSGHPMHDNEWGYGNFSPQARSYEHIFMITMRAKDLKEKGAQPIKTWSLMKQSLRNKFGVENHERQRQCQVKGKIIESSMGEKSTNSFKLSQAQDVVDRKVIHHEKKNTCAFVEEEKSRAEKVKSVLSTKESEGKRKESECLIENYESLKEEEEKEKQDKSEKSEETKEEMSLIIF